MSQSTPNNVSRLVAPGGTLLVVAAAYGDAAPRSGSPWPLRRDEFDAFSTDGLRASQIESAPGQPGECRWRAEFTAHSR